MTKPESVIHSDKFTPLPIGKLYSWIMEELKSGTVFGIPKNLFFLPSQEDNFRTVRFGRVLETPLGLAAGPHTQLAQNIICGWLTGARYIELKTVQELDDIDVTKPCIDMRDEGYNCEWSQELNIGDSFSEYLKAFILIHILKNKLNIKSSTESGFIFNMSAGYDLTGIKKEKVKNFLKQMRNCKTEKFELLKEIETVDPDVRSFDIPNTISDNITVSTMHGTPPEEVEKIGRYFIEEADLHTIIKLNPTLLGEEQVRKIVNTNLGYDVVIPDSAFDHDLKYDDAVDLVKNLRQIAAKHNKFFGLKLTNTLECFNGGDVLPEKEKMAYLSGKALHPIAINIAKKFRNDISAELEISFSAGVDAFNFKDVILANLTPITVSSDLLKPGGYGRLPQYLSNLSEEINKSGSNDIKNFILKTGNGKDLTSSALRNLIDYSGKTVTASEYKSFGFKKKETKTDRELTLFDCIKAPCTDSCGTSQNVPEYMYLTSIGKFDKALETVLETNPFPAVTGMVCDHKCQTTCTRSNYDNPLRIRDIKRFLTEFGEEPISVDVKTETNKKVSIIGSGPSGLSCLYFLLQSGINVKLYEKDDKAGGMVRKVIPTFRLGEKTLEKDIGRILTSKVSTEFNKNINSVELKKLMDSNDFVYVSTGAPESVRLEIEGIESKGVLDPLKFLEGVKQGNNPWIGKNIAVIGGGNTAFDTARTALRFAGKSSLVTILYRRTKKEMPAETSEIISALREGVKIIELTAPKKVITDKHGNVTGLSCFKTKLSKPDRQGKIYPVKVEGSDEIFKFDTIIPAVGQRSDPFIIDNSGITLEKGGRLKRSGNLLVGGDAAFGASSIVNAVGDGREAAQIILDELKLKNNVDNFYLNRNLSSDEIRLKKYRRVYGESFNKLSSNEKHISKLPEPVMSMEEAVEEAKRCLLCDEICDICVTVCPNRANISYEGETVSLKIPKFEKINNNISVVDEEFFEINQKHQVLHIVDFCNHCGNCTTFCPTGGRPFMDKPRIALSEVSFNNEDNVYFIFMENNTKKIVYKNGSKKTIFYTSNGISNYSSDRIALSFKIEEQEIFDIRIKFNVDVIPDFKNIITMKYVLDNIPKYLPLP